MVSLEKLRSEKRRLLAKKSFEDFSLSRKKEKAKLKSEIFALKHPNLKNLPKHIKGRTGMAKERIENLLSKIKESQKNQKKRGKSKNTSGFDGINLKALTG